MKQFYSLKKLITYGKTLGDSVDTVSFDLFDTLLIRRVHDPDLIKVPVARYIAERAKLRGLKCSPENVQQVRDEIESRHRQRNGQKFDDHEACYPEYMREMLATVFQDNEVEKLLEDVTSYELFMESSMLVARRLFIDWLGELHEQGKQIIVISDVYLPASHLEVLIEQAGFKDFVTGVVSSADSCCAKASGAAFPLVEKRFSLDKEKWMHVGDNPISDGVRPHEYGIQSLVLLDVTEKHRKSVVGKYFTYSRGLPFWRGRTLQQLMQPLEKENSSKDILYREGYNFLGPLIGGFVQEVAEQCRALNIGKIFFLSREGWTFKRFWEASVPYLFPDGNLPEIEYLYVSRLALAGASCAHSGLTREKADIAFLPPGNRDFRDICRIFALDFEPFKRILAEYHLKIDTPLSPVHDGFEAQFRRRFNDLLEDGVFQAEVMKQTSPAHHALELYLKDVDFFSHSDVAIVDVGWLGSIQRFLHDAVKHRSDCPCFHGFLFGATRRIPFPTTRRNYIQGVIYDRYRFNFGASALLYSRDLFEEACRAPFPTLQGYGLTDDGYKLHFRVTDDDLGEKEQKQDRYFASLRQGIEDAAPRYGAASALLGFTLNDYRAWFNYLLIVKLAFPRTYELEALRYKYHLDDFHGSKTPSKKLRAHVELWNMPGQKIRFNPFLRLRFFMKHVRAMLQDS